MTKRHSIDLLYKDMFSMRPFRTCFQQTILSLEFNFARYRNQDYFLEYVLMPMRSMASVASKHLLIG